MNLAIARVLRYPVAVSDVEFLVVFTTSFTGIAAGIYPVFKATQIHPMYIIRMVWRERPFSAGNGAQSLLFSQRPEKEMS